MGANDSDVEYSLPEVAVLTCVAVSAVRQWVRAGRLPGHAGPDGNPRVRRSDLARFCDEHGMPPVEELGAAVRKLEELLAAAHPEVRARMLRMITGGAGLPAQGRREGPDDSA